MFDLNAPRADPRPVPAARVRPGAPGQPTLSFCVVTRGPAERVRSLLATVRPHVDEIVLAVDRTAPADVLAASATLADKRITFAPPETGSWLTGWILHQCSGDWILRLDDDEIPSAALLEALPALLTDRYPAAFELRRRWLHPTPDRYILAAPWAQEWQTRLLRNVPGQWHFDGRVHTDVTVRGERRLVDLPIYHLDLIVQSLADRRSKSMKYESLRPGLEYNDFPVNGLYLPEELSELSTAPVPEADRETIRAVLDGSVEPPPVELMPAPVTIAADRDIARYNEQRPVPESAYQASIEFVHDEHEFAASGLRHHEILVHNQGDETWPAGDLLAPLIRMGYRWRDAASGRVTHDGRSLFTETVRPGQTTRIRLFSPTPSEPGDYVLEVDLVHEHVRWFGCAAELPVRVVERPRRALIEATLDERRLLDAERLRLRESEASARRAAAEAGRDADEARQALADFQRTRRYRLAQRAAGLADTVRRRLS